MISFEDALEIVLNQARPLETERVGLSHSAGRILAEEIVSDMDMPPFDKSAVDGFACRWDDIPLETPHGASLRISETIPAGRVPTHRVGPGQCARIMTGAMVPVGADCVVMVEDTEPSGEDSVLVRRSPKSRNICYRGEDIRSGSLVLAKGSRIGPAEVAVLASVGAAEPLVAKLPAVAILSTGDELVEPPALPGPGKIRNSNGWQLDAQVAATPAIPHYLGIAPDEGPALRAIIDTALAGYDVVLITGGVSMGDYDFIPGILKDAGVEILFSKVAIQPGKPTVFGTKGETIVFGLPGNPVSSFVLFEMMVKPFLLKRMGYNRKPAELILPMGKEYSRRNTERRGMIPVLLKNGAVFPADYHGSAHIHAYAGADAILVVEPGISQIKQGEPAHVRPL